MVEIYNKIYVCFLLSMNECCWPLRRSVGSKACVICWLYHIWRTKSLQNTLNYGVCRHFLHTNTKITVTNSKKVDFSLMPPCAKTLTQKTKSVAYEFRCKVTENVLWVGTRLRQQKINKQYSISLHSTYNDRYAVKWFKGPGGPPAFPESLCEKVEKCKEAEHEVVVEYCILY